MNGLNYNDIFATKGYEYLLVIVFLVSFIFFLRYLNSPRKESKARVTARSLQPDKLNLDMGLFYSPGHSWVKLEDDGRTSLGIDAFLERIVGKIDKIAVLKEGTKVTKNKVIVSLKQGDKELKIKSPVNGKVSEINMKVLMNPSNLKGKKNNWVVKVEPTSIDKDIKGLFVGSSITDWMSKEVGKLRDFLQASFAKPGEEAYSLLDGGMPVEGALETLDAENWSKFNKEFLDSTK